MALIENTDEEFLLIHLDPRDFQADLKVYVDIQERFKGKKRKDLARLRELDLIIPKLQEEKLQKSAEVFQAKELLDRFKNSYSYGSKTSEMDGERRKLGDLDEKHFLLKHQLFPRNGTVSVTLLIVKIMAHAHSIFFLYKIYDIHKFYPIIKKF